jgi:hypothetical protein
MNISKKNDARCWKKWARSGSVSPGNAVMKKVRNGIYTIQYKEPMSVEKVEASMKRCGIRPVALEELLDIVDSTPIPAPRYAVDVPRYVVDIRDVQAQFDFGAPDQWSDRFRALFVTE